MPLGFAKAIFARKGGAVLANANIIPSLTFTGTGKINYGSGVASITPTARMLGGGLYATTSQGLYDNNAATYHFIASNTGTSIGYPETKNFTCSFWMKGTTADFHDSTGRATIWSIANSNSQADRTGEGCVFLDILDTDAIEFNVQLLDSTGQQNRQITTATSIGLLDGNWHNVFVQYRGNESASTNNVIYLDGVDITNTAPSTALNSNMLGTPASGFNDPDAVALQVNGRLTFDGFPADDEFWSSGIRTGIQTHSFGYQNLWWNCQTGTDLKGNQSYWIDDGAYFKDLGFTGNANGAPEPDLFFRVARNFGQADEIILNRYINSTTYNNSSLYEGTVSSAGHTLVGDGTGPIGF